MTYKRRTFLKTTAVASAAIAAMPSLMASVVKPSTKIGVQLYTVRNEMSSDPKGTLEKIARIGYQKLEGAGYDAGKIYGFSGKEFGSIVSDLGMELTSGHMSSQVFAEGFDQALEFMVDAGQQYAVFPWLSPEQRVSLDQYKGYAATLSKCAEKAKSAGITVCYHNHDFEFQELDGELPMNILLSETDPEMVKIELDLYWITRAGLDPIQFFKDNSGRVPMWHVKDIANTPERGFAEVGTGTIDFKAIFAEKKTSGMKHFFVEQDQSANPLKSIELSYKNLTEKILG